MDTDKVGEATVFEVDDGNLRFKALGLTMDEVSIKKISNKKIISVMEAMLNSALILFLFFKAILINILVEKNNKLFGRFLQEIHKLDRSVFHIVHYFFNIAD